MKKQLPGWAVLLIITLVAGLALGGTYALTKDPIAEQALLQAEAARKAALPEADTFQALTLAEGAPVDWANAGLQSAKGKAVPLTLGDIDAIAGATITSTAVVDAINAAYEKYKAAPSDAAFTGEAQGFASPVQVTATFDGDTISTLTIGDGRFAETAGLGARAQESAFVDQFTAGEKVVGYVSQITVKGYKGPVEVTVGLDPDLVLTGISVGGSDFAETAGLGAKAKEPAFQSQFAGKKTPVSVIKTGGTPGDNTVDAITAATITSNAVRDAVNTVAKYVKSDILGIADIEMPARPADESTIFSAKERGFASPVYVEAAFDADGKITYISVGDEEFAETAGYGAAALEKENQYPFIGAQMPLELGDVDALTGATFTKTAIVNGLNKAYDASKGTEVPAAEPAAEIVLPEKPAEGVYSAEAEGFASPVYVEAAFDADGKITYISVGDKRFAETEGFGARALTAEEQIKFIGAQMPLELGDVDALTGATFTKTAIVNGLNKAYDASKGTEVPAAEPAAEIVLPEKPAEGVYSAEAEGFASPVYVEAAFDADGKITYISVGDKRFAETEGFGARALTAEEQIKFIGAQMPLELGDVDALTGATFTKTAIVSALNAAYSKAAAPAAPQEQPVEQEAEPAPQPESQAEIPVAEPVREPAEEPKQEAAPAATGAAVGEAVSFFSTVKAEAAFDGSRITALTLTEKTAGTEEYKPLAQGDALTAALIGTNAPADPQAIAADVPDYVKVAVALAVNEAYAQAGGTPAGSACTGEAVVFFTTVRAEAAFADGKLAALQLTEKAVGSSEYTSLPQESAYQAALIGQALPLSDADIADAPGYLNTAVVIAVNDAYAQSLAGQQ